MSYLERDFSEFESMERRVFNAIDYPEEIARACEVFESLMVWRNKRPFTTDNLNISLKVLTTENTVMFKTLQMVGAVILLLF